jgi:hypothetical protein
MKKVLVCVVLISSFLFASTADSEKDKRTKEAIAKAIEKEKLYAKEKMFYDYDSYDFNDSKVNEESIPTLPEIEVNDLDMDDVYD